MPKQPLSIPKNLNNPSKADVIDAFARAFDTHTTPLTFHMEGGETVQVKVNGIAYESGTPHMLCVDGYFVGDRTGSFKGFYRTDERSGHFNTSK